MILFNTSTRNKEKFEPHGDHVSIYVCGITPYDTTHLGHAFTYASTDILIRFLEYQGRGVRYVQNVTDIDDDILRRAREVGENWRQLGNRWTAHYIEDMIALNVRPPDVFPRATDVIPDIVREVQKLEAAEVAYRAGESVYFDVKAWQRFGRFGNYSYEEMLNLANQRGNNPDDTNKKDPLDFVLWQGCAPGEPSWDSPWGPGRPGWHIECSTMAGKFLGRTIDIHGGGTDLAFPHHEGEIAQMEALPGAKPFSRFWLHVAMVEYEGDKMSKSLGNLVMVRDLLREVQPDVLRLYLAGFHYRDTWSYDHARLLEAEKTVTLFLDALRATPGQLPMPSPMPEREAFEQALSDDLYTPAAIAALESLANRIQTASNASVDVLEAQLALRKMTGVLGLRLGEPGPEERVVAGWRRHLSRFQE